MRAITQNEFIQGAVFTHKGTKQLYSSLKYLNSNLYCVVDFLYCVVDFGTHTTHTAQVNYFVKNITKSSFDIEVIFFDSVATKTVLFADCFAIENQPKAQEK